MKDGTRLKKSGNQWRQMRRIAKALQAKTQEFDWRFSLPEWFDIDAHCKLRDYVRGRLDKNEQGRINRIMGGPAQTDAINDLLWAMVNSRLADQ